MAGWTCRRLSSSWFEEVLACWQRISVPVLWIEAEDAEAWRWMGTKEQAWIALDRLVRSLYQVKTVTVRNAGHMLHHDQSQAVAELLEEFL